MQLSVRRIVCALAAAALTAACGGTSDRAGTAPSNAHAAKARRARDRATIDTPRAGTRTNARTIVVAGALPALPKGGDASVTVVVDGRPTEVEPGGGRYRVEVLLTPGANRITANALIYTAGGDERATPESAPVTVTRTGPRGAPRLDLATAELVAESSDAYYWLCGESEDCGKALRCYAVDARRVDCPIAWMTVDDPVAHCATVITVSLHGRRVYYAGYPCRGRLTPDPRRHVKPDVALTGRRFRLDEHQSPWLRDEVNERIHYGIPRFDVGRDVLIP